MFTTGTFSDTRLLIIKETIVLCRPESETLAKLVELDWGEFTVGAFSSVCPFLEQSVCDSRRLRKRHF